MTNKKIFFLFTSKKPFQYIYFFIFVNIIYIIKASEDSKNIIVIPFNYYKPKSNSEYETKQTNLLTSWLRQKMYLTMENSNGQKSSMILTLDQIDAHSKEDIALIASDEKYVKIYTQNTNDICSFNYENSRYFKCQTPYNIYLFGRDKCCIVEEKFNFYTDLKLQEKKIFPFKFIHTTNQTNICLFGSLQKNVKNNDKSKSFIDQLRELSGSKTYTWTLKYTSYDSGLFIFGDIINNEKIKFNEKNTIKNIETNYESLYTTNLFTSKIFWKISINKLIFDDVVLGEEDFLEIETDTPFILLKKDYFHSIKDKLFNEYFEQKICDKNIPEYQLSSVSCKKKQFLEKTNNLKNIPSITFQIKQNNLNITFTPNDFFRIEGDDIYCLIAHHSYKDSQSTVGSIFLKKYTTIFDLDSKQMKILKNVNNEITEKKGNGRKIFLIVFLTIIFSGIIFGFVGLKYGKKIYQSRKIKANELDDNYDYTQYNTRNDINYEKKYGLFSNEGHKNKIINEIGLEMTKS